MKRIVDLRSDTFSMPSEGMRSAMYAAEVGNSGFREDPSVNELEEECAAFFGQAAAVFLPSGTMAGQIAITIRSRPGDLIAIEENGHNLRFEAGSMAVVSGTQALAIPGNYGILALDRVKETIAEAEDHGARVALVVLENTSNFGGGTIYPFDVLADFFSYSAAASRAVHIDGARIWNAIASKPCEPESLIAPGGTLSACLSKGLGAPMGSVLVGPSDLIEEARRVQQILGGVMRQVGFMAAAGLYALRNNRDRLVEDHDNCRLMAEILAGNAGAEIDPAAVQTNILYFRVRGGEARAADLLRRMEAEGILAFRVGDRVRLVTCLNVDREDCRRAAERIDALLKRGAGS